jgi:tetratricopeptide (TPR) repeat protein
MANRITLRRTAAPMLALATLAGAAGCRRDPQAAVRQYVESGSKYAEQGKYAEAVVQFRNAIQRDPKSGDAHEKLAQALLQAGDAANALGEYIRAADLEPDNAQLQLKTGDLLLLAGKPEDAKARAARVLATQPDNVDAQILTANALAGLKDLDAAVAQIEDALRVDPDRGGTYSSLGALELSRGKRDAAEAAFKKAVELNPDSPLAHLALGNFYWLTNRPADAEQALTRALDLDPKNALINRALANFYLASGQPERAEAPLKTIYALTKSTSSAFSLVEYYLATKKEPDARTLLESLLKDPRAATTANARLATLDYEHGQRDSAYQRLDGVLSKDAGNLQALLVKTSLLLSDKRPEDALQTVSAAVERYPQSTPAQFMLGRVQAARRQPEAAMAAYREVLRLNPRATDAKLALAQLQLAQGQPDASVGLASEALVAEPSNADAELLLVRGLLTKGDLDRAGLELGKLMQRFPNSAVVHTQMGMLLGRRHDATGARAEFDRALQLNPNLLEALGGQVSLDLSAKDYARAKARVDEWVAARPSSPALVLAARTYAAGRDLPGAEALLRRAIGMDSADLDAYSTLGQVLVAERKLPQAKTEFENVVKQAPKSVGALTMLGILLQADGDIDGARERFEQVVQIDPGAAVAANNLAWIYAEHGGNLDVALDLAKSAQNQLPEAPEVADTVGYIYIKKDLPTQAISTLEFCVEKNPQNAVYQYHLGLAYSKAGDKERSREHLTKALALQPDFDGAAQARSLLQTLANTN